VEIFFIPEYYGDMNFFVVLKNVKQKLIKNGNKKMVNINVRIVIKNIVHKEYVYTSGKIIQKKEKNKILI